MAPDNRPRKIALSIAKDITQREGLRQLWAAIGPGMRSEIVARWTAIIRQGIEGEEEPPEGAGVEAKTAQRTYPWDEQ